jgi:hypothetical protein
MEDVQWKFLEPMALTAWLPDGQPIQGVTRKNLARIACRLLASDRHVDAATPRVVRSGPWGRVVTYATEKATVGLVVEPRSIFHCVSVLPDIAHFFAKEEIKEQPTVRVLFEAKHFRLFATGDDSVYDLVLTVKNRWFRHVNNPKFLGLNKEYKP